MRKLIGWILWIIALQAIMVEGDPGDGTPSTLGQERAELANGKVSAGEDENENEGQSEPGSICGNDWFFKTRGAAEAAARGERVIEVNIADPSFDQTFKKIFSMDEKGKKRLISFLNGIYFSDAGDNDVKIRKIEPLDKEGTSLGKTSHEELTLCDIACKCYYYAIKEGDSCETRRGAVQPCKVQSFDVEIQRAQQTGFSLRLLDYCGFLRKQTKTPVRALGLLNYTTLKRWNDKTESFAYCKIDPTTGNPMPLQKEEKAIVATDAIDLRKFSQKDKKVEIYIDGKKLGDLGLNWLKLIGVKQWADAVENTENTVFKIYYLEEKTVSELRDAIQVLSTLDESTLSRLQNLQRGQQDALKTSLKEGMEAGRKEEREKAYQEKLESARKMLTNGLSEEQVVEFLGLTQEEIEALRDRSTEEGNKKLPTDLQEKLFR